MRYLTVTGVQTCALPISTAQSQLFALDARDGRSCAGFGRSGMVDLKAGLRIPPFEPGAYSMTSPPVVVNGLVITGSSIARSEEHTSELQSQSNLVCRLLLEKKKVMRQ